MIRRGAGAQVIRGSSTAASSSLDLLGFSELARRAAKMMDPQES
jgi:hypothetical protein